MPSKSRAKFVIYQRNGKFHWTLVVRGKAVAHSAVGTARKHDTLRAVRALAHHVESAEIVEQ